MAQTVAPSVFVELLFSYANNVVSQNVFVRSSTIESMDKLWEDISEPQNILCQNYAIVMEGVGLQLMQILFINVIFIRDITQSAGIISWGTGKRHPVIVVTPKK